MKIILSAGGQGTKFWPYSRQAKPKQFQPLLGDKSLFQYNVEVLLKSYSADDIYVSTKRGYLGTALEQVTEIPVKNYILEPDVAKNRGPSEGLVFTKMSVMHPGEPIILIQVDVTRSPAEKYLETLAEMEKLVVSTRKYLTGGVKATEPVMGVDYLKLGSNPPVTSALEVFEIKEFVDRMTTFRETKQLVSDFHVVIHCNHTCWYPELLLEEYKKYKPEWYASLQQIKEAFGQRGEEKTIEAIYDQMPAGMTEQVLRHTMAGGLAVLLPFKWTDLGTWNSLYDYYLENGKKLADCPVVEVDASNNLVKVQDPHKLVALIGTQDLVVVDMNDVLFIAPRDRVAEVSKVLKELEAKDLGKFL